ncbi:MAG: hypothetical protein P0119_08080 [Nitrospira sp.]|nr:hypothetical protein [Nitrospira sp.]
MKHGRTANSMGLRQGVRTLAAKVTDTVALAAMPHGPRKLAIKFGTATPTHSGGLYLLHRFLLRIGFKAALVTQIQATQPNNGYSIGQLMPALPYPTQSEVPTPQLTLFKGGRYHHHILVPNLPLRPLSLRRFYNNRAGSG